MRPTQEQILSFLDKANEIRDIHEVLPSDDPEAYNKAIVDVFYERFVNSSSRYFILSYSCQTNKGTVNSTTAYMTEDGKFISIRELEAFVDTKILPIGFERVGDIFLMNILEISHADFVEYISEQGIK